MLNQKGRTYKKDTSGRLYWCNTHQRRATHVYAGEPHCDPNLGGITMPCLVVDLTDIAEIEPESEKENQ